MIQEDKELLLKDLCSRLPYGVKVKTPYNDANLAGVVNRKGVRKDIDYVDVVTDKQTYPIRYIKPFLRHMSSMTEEERKEYKGFIVHREHVNAQGQEWDIDCFCFGSVSRLIDWLNAHHFDYRGLIGKGLAIEVSPNNNPYKE